MLRALSERVRPLDSTYRLQHWKRESENNGVKKANTSFITLEKFQLANLKSTGFRKIVEEKLKV